MLNKPPEKTYRKKKLPENTSKKASRVQFTRTLQRSNSGECFPGTFFEENSRRHFPKILFSSFESFKNFGKRFDYD